MHVKAIWSNYLVAVEITHTEKDMSELACMIYPYNYEIRV